jgi:hypothetical protein
VSSKTLLTEELVKWLLAGEPWVVHHTLTDLLDKDEEDKAVMATKRAIPEHPLMKKIFKGLTKEGYYFLDSSNACGFRLYKDGQKNR